MVPFLVFGLTRWFWFMAMVGILLGGAELASKMKTGKSLSQKFWVWSKENRIKAWIILVSMGISWTLLLLHLAWKMITS